jgi:hypothetical protein
MITAVKPLIGEKGVLEAVSVKELDMQRRVLSNLLLAAFSRTTPRMVEPMLSWLVPVLILRLPIASI